MFKKMVFVFVLCIGILLMSGCAGLSEQEQPSAAVTAAAPTEPPAPVYPLQAEYVPYAYTRLDDTQKQAYDAMRAGFLLFAEEIFLSVTLAEDDVRDIYWAVMKDDILLDVIVDVVWFLGPSYGRCDRLEVLYTNALDASVSPSPDAYQALERELEALTEPMLAGIKQGMTPLEQYRYLSEQLLDSMTYHYDALDDSGSFPDAYTFYGALKEKAAVCKGIGEAFQYVCRRAGLWCIQVEGYANDMGHLWNLVRIDGAFYHVDLTWGIDDFDRYFLLNDAQIELDHEIRRDRLGFAIPQALGGPYQIALEG